MEMGQPVVVCVKPYNHTEKEDSDEELLSNGSIKAAKAARCPQPTHSPAPPTSATRGGSEQVTTPQLATEDVSKTLEWFREILTRIGKGGRVTLKDFKCAARECVVSALCTSKRSARMYALYISCFVIRDLQKSSSCCSTLIAVRASAFRNWSED